MVLIEAEAKAMLNDITGAQNALAILEEERDSAFDKTAYTDQDALMTQIKFQRTVNYGEKSSVPTLNFVRTTKLTIQIKEYLTYYTKIISNKECLLKTHGG